VELHTQHLHIADDEEEDGSDNRLVIEGSRLLGQDGAGLLVGSPTAGHTRRAWRSDRSCRLGPA